MNNQGAGVVKRPKIAVLGDLVLDMYTFGDISRISPEAPVPILEVRRREQRLGGSGNVVLNLCALDLDCIPFGRIGHDLHGKVVRSELERKQVSSKFLMESSELPTITKHRMVARNQQVIRIDEERIEFMARNEEDEILKNFRSIVDELDVVVLSDYGKGFLSDYLIKKIIIISREHKKPVVVDPKGNDFTRYRGATTITPNLKEAQLAAPRSRTIVEIAEVLIEQADLSFLMLTRSEDGISHFKMHDGLLEHEQFPVQIQEVTDVTGAGDTVVAVTAMALALGWDYRLMCQACNVAAGYVVGHFGAATIPWLELKSLLQQKGLIPA
jgi:D-glycero-beta-D-manno-heptose-7-phosphate kinase